MFIDKPLAASLGTSWCHRRLGREVLRSPASRPLRAGSRPAIRSCGDNDQVGEILGCDTYSQSRAVIGHPDLFWDGVHGVDLLYSLMGTGCRQVTAVQTSSLNRSAGPGAMDGSARIGRSGGAHREDGAGGHGVRHERHFPGQQLLRLLSAGGCYREILSYLPIADSATKWWKFCVHDGSG